MQCRYNAVNFLPNPHKIHLIARPLGRDMGCNLWFDTLIYILSQSTQCGMKYPVILDRVITALYCTMFFPELFSSYEYLLLYNTKNRRYKLPKLTFLEQIGRLHTFRFIKQFIRKFMSAINLRFNQYECIQNVSSGHSSIIHSFKFHYNTVYVFLNSQKTTHISPCCGQAMGCLMWGCWRT